MATTPLFHLTTPLDGEAGIDRSSLAPVQILLECMTRIDEWHIRRSLRRVEKGLSDTVVPPLYGGTVAYRPRPRGRQDWLDVPAALERGAGDAEDLAAWRAAELRVGGVAAEPVVGLSLDGARPGVRFAVRMPDGAVEDPARALGRADDAPGSGIVVRPLVHLSLPDSDDGAHFAPLQIALEGLAQVDEWQIRRALARAAAGTGEALPALYESGVRYQEEPPGHEDWLDAPEVVRQGVADCEDLAAYRAAELRVAGHDCEPVIKWQWIPREMMLAQGYPASKLPDRGVWMVHCCVRFPDGSVEDPSKILGMGGSFTDRI
jgi:hypothetical protein